MLSALRLGTRAVGSREAGEAILVALAANGAGRHFLATLAGPVRFRVPLGMITLLAAGEGWAALLLVS